ncbi:MAG: hypothetical protein H6R24_2579 [Proteobacteria bacterium]|nr:hypothetical protein [Pseudomonadota bacterium]
MNGDKGRLLAADIRFSSLHSGKRRVVFKSLNLCDAIITERRRDFRRNGGEWRLEVVLRAHRQYCPVEGTVRLEVDATPRLFPVAIAGRLRAFGAAILLGAFGRFNVLGGVGGGDGLLGQRRLLMILAHAAHFLFEIHGWRWWTIPVPSADGTTGHSKRHAFVAQQEHSGLYFSGFIMPITACERNERRWITTGPKPPSGIEP